MSCLHCRCAENSNAFSLLRPPYDTGSLAAADTANHDPDGTGLGHVDAGSAKKATLGGEALAFGDLISLYGGVSHGCAPVLPFWRWDGFGAVW